MSTMTAMLLKEYGDPEQLHVATVARPVPAPNQMLVAVRACGVCGHDLLARRGALGTDLPVVLGHEIAGVVAEIGSDVKAFAAGDRVALVQRIPCGECEQCSRGATNLCRNGLGFYGDDLSGGYAEYVIATEANAVRLPDDLDFETGAVLSCAVGTGLRALRHAELQAGDTVVITGAGGGVGLHGVRLAAALGYRVLAVSGSPHKHDRILAAGAERVVEPGAVNSLRDVVRQTFGVRGAAAAIEVAGTPTFDASLASLGPGGRLVLVGNTAPSRIATNPGALIVRELKIIGSAHATLRDLEEVVALVRTGQIDVDVPVALDLTEAAALHRALEDREVAGRAVLTVGKA